jgi:hypothetical protein
MSNMLKCEHIPTRFVEGGLPLVLLTTLAIQKLLKFSKCLRIRHYYRRLMHKVHTAVAWGYCRLTASGIERS